MRCPQCEFDNRSAVRFCEQCGVKLEQACPACGASVPPDRKFCGACGQLLAPKPQSRPKLAAPDLYTPKHLAERILTSKSALEGERKQVTVLFADLKGSMELLADRDPEEARKLLDPVLERMMEAVHHYEGTVNQVMGDGIMALFGAPLAHEDHAVRACYAALRMQESVRQYADGIRRDEGVSIQIRVGVNSGDVVVRSIGSDLRMDYTAVGQTTHLAARMEQLATPGSIAVAPETLRLAEGYVTVKPLGPVNVKGMSEPVDVYEVTSAGAVRTRLQRSAARGFSRFVGRDAELDLLRGAFERAAGGHGQVVAVVGEPGVGKSRLFYEFVHSHRTHDWLVVESGSVSYGMATPYLPVIDLLKAYFQIDARDDGRTIREKVTGKLLTLDETLRPLLPALLALLDVPVEDRDWQAFYPPQRRRHTHDAIRRLLLRESQRQPLCLVFEDLHWIDAESQAVLDGLVESLPAARLLLLVNYRPEYRHTWGSKTYYSQARIDPLPQASATELLGALLGADASIRPLIPLLIERTEGNPFFLEESVRALVETGMLAGDPGRYRLARPLVSIQVPATVQAVLAARIDRLPPQEKSLLQSASVVGKDVPFAELRAIAELPEEALRAELAHLQAAEFLYETSLFPDLEYTFKHALTHEVAYGSVLHERRRALHARIVEAIEALHPDRLGEHVERLAQHALRGEVWPKAVAYLRQAAAKAVARSANREAVSCLEQALGALRHLPESLETREQAIDLRLELQIPLNGLGEIERLLDYLREAEPLAGALGDLPRRGRVAAYMAWGLNVTGRSDQATVSGEQALAIARTIGDLGLEALANQRLGQAYYRLGEYPRAIAAFKRNVDALVGDLQTESFGMPGPPAVMSRAYMGWCLADLGEFPAAMAAAEEAVRMAEAAHDRPGLAFSQSRVGLIYLRQGDPERALPWLERSLDGSRRFNFEIVRLMTAGPLGEARAACGATGEAFALLEQAAEQAASIRAVIYLPGILGGLGEGYLLAGRLVEARYTAERVLQLTRASGQRHVEADALRILGEVHARANPVEAGQAEESYREALGIAEQLGTRPLAARCHLGLGRLYRATGQQEAAQHHLATAATMFRDMDMRSWLAKTAEMDEGPRDTA
jgi:class 3 adenylate cyclase/tetratricopeptide (TPR) repeat protein